MPGNREKQTNKNNPFFQQLHHVFCIGHALGFRYNHPIILVKLCTGLLQRPLFSDTAANVLYITDLICAKCLWYAYISPKLQHGGKILLFFHCEPCAFIFAIDCALAVSTPGQHTVYCPL